MARRWLYAALVAPLAGAWIEMICYYYNQVNRIVAPLAGAWIEISDGQIVLKEAVSLPSRERGLK